MSDRPPIRVTSQGLDVKCTPIKPQTSSPVMKVLTLEQTHPMLKSYPYPSLLLGASHAPASFRDRTSRATFRVRVTNLTKIFGTIPSQYPIFSRCLLQVRKDLPKEYQGKFERTPNLKHEYRYM